MQVLSTFGFAELGLKQSDFTEAGQLIQLGRAPNRIDLLTSLTGVSLAEAFASKFGTEMDGTPVFVLSKEALIQNKRAVGRPRDLADLRELEG
jgi:hypothetical protein